MRIAVAGATGRAGRHVVDVLRERGHDAVAISRANGVDVITGEGLAEALRGADAIIDVATGPSPEQEPATAFFTTAARNLQQSDAKLIVAASIIGIDKLSGGYNMAKVAHERVLREGPIPVRILRAAQFHEFVEQLMQWGTQGDTAYVPNMRTQLVAARAVAERLVELATGDGPELSEIAGPREERLAEMAKLVAARRGPWKHVQEVMQDGDPDARLYADGALLPGPGAVLAGPTFQEWLTSDTFTKGV
jgi:uncharacterized protein YbjT (DUF2867 family)